MGRAGGTEALVAPWPFRRVSRKPCRGRKLNAKQAARGNAAGGDALGETSAFMKNGGKRRGETPRGKSPSGGNYPEY